MGVFDNVETQIRNQKFLTLLSSSTALLAAEHLYDLQTTSFLLPPLF